MKEALALDARFAEETCESLTASEIGVKELTSTSRRQHDPIAAQDFPRLDLPAAAIPRIRFADIELIRRQERERIERDLHDELGGHLSALKLLLNLACQQIPANTALAEQRALWSQLIDSAIDSVHRITHHLQPPVLANGLPAALEVLAREQTQYTGMPYALHHGLPEIDIDPVTATALFRVAQESCNNIRKYARASHVDLYLLRVDAMLVLEVIDNGVGFATEQIWNSPYMAQCLGVRGMRERIESLGGEFYIASRPGQGTLVRAAVPLTSAFRTSADSSA
jgi:signal transduction histidine kinase